MKLTFLGTRGEIEARTDRHGMHSALLVSYRGRRVMLDCGADWLGRFERFGPRAAYLVPEGGGRAGDLHALRQPDRDR